MKKISDCLLCGSKSSSPYYSYGAPNKIKVYNRICDECGLVFQSPTPDFEDLKQYYENYMKVTRKGMAHIPFYFEEFKFSISRMRMNYIIGYLKSGDRVLDIGCSFGSMLKVLRDESGLDLELVGVNPEASLALFGKEKYGLDIKTGMFEEQGFHQSSFDFVILDNVIEHFDSPVECIRNIHKLLSANGRVFIATNNLDEPHGFLWQNFFQDHTVTFSHNTLKAMLESCGFEIINQDLAGHVTYVGYHYPYQYCIATKKEIPHQYDFKTNGDDATEMLNKVRKYRKDYFKDNGLAKRLYEFRINKKSNFILKSLSFIKKLTNRTIVFQMQDHTLPHEDYFYRRVMVAECETDNDLELAYKIYNESELNPILFVLYQDYDGNLTSRCCPSEYIGLLPHTPFRGRKQFLDWLLSNLPRIDEVIFLHLSNSDICKDALFRMHEIFRRKGTEHALVSLGDYKKTYIEFFKRSALKKLTIKDKSSWDGFHSDDKKEYNKLWFLEDNHRKDVFKSLEMDISWYD